MAEKKNEKMNKIMIGETEIIAPEEFWKRMGVDVDSLINKLFPPFDQMYEEAKKVHAQRKK